MASKLPLVQDANSGGFGPAGRRLAAIRTLTDAVAIARFYDAGKSQVVERKVSVVDISESGISLRVEDIARLPNRLDLDVYFPHGTYPLKGAYEVRWFRSDAKIPAVVYGLKLVKMSPDSLKMLGAYLADRGDVDRLFRPVQDSVVDQLPARPLSRGKKVRQQRLELADSTVQFHLGGQRFDVVNLSAFGLALRVTRTATWDTKKKYSGELKLGEILIQRVDLRPIREEIRSETLTLLGFEIVGEPLEMEKVTAMKTAGWIVACQQQKLAQVKRIPTAIRYQVLEGKNILSSLEKEVNALTLESPRTGYGAQESFEITVCEVVAQFLGQTMTPLYDHVVEAISGLPKDEQHISLDFVREELQGFLFQAPFAFRSYAKPLGYAGDFEMMNLIYRDQPEGATLFAKALHRYFINQPAACAVRNRVDYIHTHLAVLVKEKKDAAPLRLASIASGPAFELEKWLEGISEKIDFAVEITLLDQDADSLRYAQRRLLGIARSRSLPVHVHCLEKSVRHVLGAGLPTKTYDFVYSLGLFDYLADNVCRAMGAKLFDALRPGGRLVIGNFDVVNPTRNTMELTLDWKLIHRSVQDMEKLFGHLDGDLRIDREKEGVNLFCVVHRGERQGTEAERRNE